MRRLIWHGQVLLSAALRQLFRPRVSRALVLVAMAIVFDSSARARDPEEAALGRLSLRSRTTSVSRSAGCIPVDPELDCNANGIADECELSSGYADDTNQDGIPDSCENLRLRGFDAKLVVRTGRIEPGMVGNFVLIRAPVVNNNKQVAFWAETAFEEVLCRWSDGQLQILVRRGDPIPGSVKFFGDFVREVSINDSGSVAFAGAALGETTNAVYLWTESGIVSVAVDGDLVTNLGGALDFSNQQPTPLPGITNAGEVYFRARIVGAPADVGASGSIVRFFGGTLTAVAASDVDYGTLGIFAAVDGGPIVALDGVVSFRATTEGITRILRYADGSQQEVVRERAHAVGTGDEFERFNSDVATAGSVETYFSGDSRGYPANGIFKQELSGKIVPLVLEGDPAPVEGSVFVLPRLVTANALGDVFFYAQLSSGDPVAGIFRYDQRADDSRTVLLDGDVGPATANTVVDSLFEFSPNSIGDVALLYRGDDNEYRLLFLDQHLSGDLDLDDDVDIIDYESFIDCMAGPGLAGGPLCKESDLDWDGDIDMDDYGLMQDAFIICQQDGADCNGNGVSDTCELEGLIVTDCDQDSVPDACQIASGVSTDCNGNLLPDACDIALLSSFDFNTNDVPDECEGFPDCNYDGVGDGFDIQLGSSEDCDLDGVPDECQLNAGAVQFIGTIDSPPNNEVLNIPLDLPGNSEVLNTGVPRILATTSTCDGRVFSVDLLGALYEMNPETGIVTYIGETGFVIPEGAAYDCATDTLYVSNSGGPGVAFGLYVVSTTDASSQLLGRATDIRGLAFDSDSDILYGLRNGLLWTLDTTTGWPTIICDNILLSQTHSLAIADGSLYTTSIGTLYELDPVGCVASVVGTLSPELGDAQSLAAVHGPTDCNANSVPDNCDVDFGPSGDINTNDVPDECEGDCNSNLVDDSAELTEVVTLVSSAYSPFGDGFPAVFEFPAGYLADSTVSILVESNADLDAPDELVGVSLVGAGGEILYADLWASGGAHCVTDSLNIEESAAGFNNIVRGGVAQIVLTTTAPVSAAECAGSFMQVTVSFDGSFDCNGNGKLDECEVSLGATPDCNANGWPDECDVSRGWSFDCENNSVPDECEALDDCNANSIPDRCETDCNGNGAPDECDLANGTSTDCDANSIPDECDPDCDGNTIADACESFEDCNGNSIPDICEADCNENGIADGCDIASQASDDCNGNGLPDECEIDCNENQVPDDCDIENGGSPDSNANGTPDECENFLTAGLMFSIQQIGPDGSHSGAVNASGEVAYRDDDGVQFSSGGVTVFKARNSDFSGFDTNSLRINDLGQLAFFARPISTNRWSLLRIDPDQTADDVNEFTVIADLSGFPFTSIPRVGSLTNGGDIIFSGAGPLPESTFIGNGSGSPHDPASFWSPFPKTVFAQSSSTVTPVLTNSGLAVALTETVSFNNVLAGINGFPPTNPSLTDYTIYNGTPPFFSIPILGPLAANDNGLVVFRAQERTDRLRRSDHDRGCCDV